MKSWQLLDVIHDDVIAESNDYMELDETRNKLLENYQTIEIPLIDYTEDHTKGDLKGRWVICNENSEFFKKRNKK